MTNLPRINARRLEKLLTKLGFELVRTKGSHYVYQHPDGRRTMFPYHGGKDLPRPLLVATLKQVGLSREQYIEHLEDL
jgi:predicted RNA binding protein YcfA (HicA-like mRNA interferase family)